MFQNVISKILTYKIIMNFVSFQKILKFLGVQVQNVQKCTEMFGIPRISSTWGTEM